MADFASNSFLLNRKIMSSIEFVPKFIAYYADYTKNVQSMSNQCGNPKGIFGNQISHDELSIEIKFLLR